MYMNNKHTENRDHCVDSANLVKQKIHHELNNLNCVPYDSIWRATCILKLSVSGIAFLCEREK